MKILVLHVHDVHVERRREIEPGSRWDVVQEDNVEGGTRFWWRRVELDIIKELLPAAGAGVGIDDVPRRLAD